MTSDPSTLLQATSGVCLIAALAYWGAAHFLGMKAAATLRWSAGNLLFALGTALTVGREGAASPVLFALADTLELTGLAMLLTGLRVFARTAPGHAEAVGVVAVGGAALWIGYAAQATDVRLAVYCAAAAWLLARSGAVAFAVARTEFGGAASAAIGLPFALGALLQLARGVAGATGLSPQAVDTLAPTPFNIGLNWAAFGIALALNVMIGGLMIGRLVMRIRAHTLTDPLTRAANRRALLDALQRELQAQKRHAAPLSLVVFDLDHFKRLNDCHGHAAGDAALQRAAAAVRAQTRDGDLVARHGGEEFCVLLPGTPIEGACLAAERMRRGLESAPLRWHGQSIPVTASFGVASADATEGVSPAQLLDRADRAMYEAKASGRNCVAAHSAADEPAAPPLPGETAPEQTETV